MLECKPDAGDLRTMHKVVAEIDLKIEESMVFRSCTACWKSVAAGQAWHARARTVCSLFTTYLGEASLHCLDEADAVLQRIDELLPRHQPRADVVAELRSRAQQHQHTALDRLHWRS
jgi:hypothetical protein